jgi:uncharacterized protein (TIGR02594 family)
MTAFDHDAFMTEWRTSRSSDGRKIAQAEYDLVMDAIRGEWRPGSAVSSDAAEPDWLTEARRHMGLKEIPGPKHNSFIAKGWARLGAGWFNDDETPWCGLFVAHCIEAAALPYPAKGMFARAKSWAEWGKPFGMLLGAVAVFGRQGGGHVGFLVGVSSSNLYILGGNQSNAVNIMPIAKSRLLALRWPDSRALGEKFAPPMTGGVRSTNEA